MALYLLIYVGAVFVAMVFSLLMTPSVLDVTGLTSVVIVASSPLISLREPEVAGLLPAPREVMAGRHR